MSAPRRPAPLGPVPVEREIPDRLPSPAKAAFAPRVKPDGHRGTDGQRHLDCLARSFRHGTSALRPQESFPQPVNDDLTERLKFAGARFPVPLLEPPLQGRTWPLATLVQGG